jgi:hypothetical protein
MPAGLGPAAFVRDHRPSIGAARDEVVGSEGEMASLRGMRFRWFVTWYLGGISFVLLLQEIVVTSTGIPAWWAFAIAFAVLFLMTFGVGFLVRAGRRRAAGPARAVDEAAGRGAGGQGAGRAG